MDEAHRAAHTIARGDRGTRTVDRPGSGPWKLMLRLPPEPRVTSVDRECLTFPDGSIDCVVLQGECGAMDGSRDAGEQTTSGVVGTLKSLVPLRSFRAQRKARVRLLAEIRRMLKPDGQIVILVGNRYDHGYLRGRRDPCSGLRFTSLLPRLIANAYSILATGKTYRACTHSLGDYHRLLRDAGYTSLEICGLTPDFIRPTELIPFGVRGQTWRVAPSRGLHRIRRNRHFVPAYAIIASNTAPARASIAEEIARGIEGALHANPDSSTFSAFRITGKNKGIVSGEIGDRSIIVKVAFDEAAESGNRRNYQFLERAQQIPELRDLVPRPVATGSVRGVRYYAETAVRGTLLDAVLNADNASSYLTGISAALRAINPHLPERPPQPFAGDAFRRQVLSPLDRIAQTTGRHSLIENVRALFRSHLENKPLRLGLVHGDFCGSNITVVGFTVTGIIDWEDTRDGGIAALDALNYVEALHRIWGRRGVTTVEILSGLDEWGSLASAEQQFLEEHYLRCGMDPMCHFALTYLYWIRHVADQLDGGLGNDPQALEERVVRPLEQFVARAHA
ncbi:MAG TPA: phosphotransferase [Rhodanobacteraceae bacterium]|nr:phosphotransferase [Rhodanobacteraceae bacterium]